MKSGFIFTFGHIENPLFSKGSDCIKILIQDFEVNHYN